MMSKRGQQRLTGGLADYGELLGRAADALQAVAHAEPRKRESHLRELHGIVDRADRKHAVLRRKAGKWAGGETDRRNARLLLIGLRDIVERIEVVGTLLTELDLDPLPPSLVANVDLVVRTSHAVTDCLESLGDASGLESSTWALRLGASAVDRSCQAEFQPMLSSIEERRAFVRVVRFLDAVEETAISLDGYGRFLERYAMQAS